MLTFIVDFFSHCKAVLTFGKRGGHVAVADPARAEGGGGQE